MPLNSSVDPLAPFLAAHADDLRRGGSVVSSFRSHNGRRLGPYYRLTCRDAQGRQCALYLASEELVAQARTALTALQAPRQQARILARAQRALRRGHRAAQAALERELNEVGLYLSGSEVRGWSKHKLGAKLCLDLPIATSGTAPRFSDSVNS